MRGDQQTLFLGNRGDQLFHFNRKIVEFLCVAIGICSKDRFARRIFGRQGLADCFDAFRPERRIHPNMRVCDCPFFQELIR